MRIGCPREIKIKENRVGLTPTSVKELISNGHDVYIESGAGLGIGETDDSYKQAGAVICNTADEVFDRSTLIVKVKEPLKEEIDKLNANHVLFTYLHLAADLEQALNLYKSSATCIAYETVQEDNGFLPLLAPMSEIAGKMSIQVGAHYLEKTNGGRGILLGGAVGLSPAKVTVVGGGVAGYNAAKMAVGLGADVTIIEKNYHRCDWLNTVFNGKCKVLYSNNQSIYDCVTTSDLVIGSVLLPGAKAPKLITADMIHRMISGSVFVDIAIDQGGCSETSQPTNHENPVYNLDNVLHYCVTNMPGAVARTSTYALNNATLPYVKEIANKWDINAFSSLSPSLQKGINISSGKFVNQAVKSALNL